MPVNPILLILLMTILGVVGDSLLKLAGNGQKFIDMRWFVAGALVYLSTAVGWFYVMKQVKLSTLGVIYALCTVLLLVIVGVVFFHEKLNVYEIVGIVFAIISLALLSRFI